MIDCLIRLSMALASFARATRFGAHTVTMTAFDWRWVTLPSVATPPRRTTRAWPNGTVSVVAVDVAAYPKLIAWVASADSMAATLAPLWEQTTASSMTSVRYSPDESVPDTVMSVSTNVNVLVIAGGVITYVLSMIWYTVKPVPIIGKIETFDLSAATSLSN